MNPTTRRSFLISIGAAIPLAGFAAWLRMKFGSRPATGSGLIPESWKSQAGSMPWPSGEPFPCLDYFEPYPAGQPVFERGSQEPSFLHPNGSWVVLPESSGGFEVWDWRQGVPVQSIGGLHRSEHILYPCGEDDLIPGCFAAGGQTWLHGRVWRGGDDGQALMGTGLDGSGTWNQSSPMTISVDPQRAVIHMAGWLGDGSEEGIFELDTESGELKRLGALPVPIQIGGYSTTARLSPDGRWLLAWHTASAGIPKYDRGWWAVWSLADGRCRAYEPCLFNHSSAFSSDGAVAYIPGKAWNWSGQPSGAEAISSPWSSGGMGPAIITVDNGKTELTRKGEGILEIRSALGPNPFRRLVAYPPNNALIAFGPKSDLLLAAPPSGQPWLWNRMAPHRKVPAVIQDEPLTRPGYSAFDYGSVRSLAWSNDGIQIGVGVDSGAIGIFDAAACRIPDGTKGDEDSLGKPIRVLTGITEAVRGLAFIPGGVAALGQNGTVAIWGGGGESPVRTWKAHPARSNSLQASPDGRVLATGSLDGIALWSVAEGKLLGRLGKSHSGVSCLHFDPTGQRVAATYLDGWLTLFDVRNGKVLWEMQAHSDVTSAVAFHPSGNWLVSLGWDGQLKKWDAKTGSAGPAFGSPKASSCLVWSRDGKWLAIGGSHPELWDESLMRVGPGLNFLWNAECT